MAISSFARNGKYELDISAISQLTLQETLIIPCSYILIELNDSSKYEFYGFNYLNVYAHYSPAELNTEFSVYPNKSNDHSAILSKDFIIVDIKKISIVYNYNSSDYYYHNATPRATLIFNGLNSQYSQVSIYDEHIGEWVNLPCASEYTGIATTLVDSGRNVEGVVIGEVVASDIAKVEMKWNFLTLEQYRDMAQLFEPKYNNNDPKAFFRAVRFFDVIKGDFDGDNTLPPNATTNRCRIMYCGDRKVSFAKMKLDDNGKPIGYQSVSLNLIDTHKIYGE